MTWNLWWRFGPWQQRQPAILETLRAQAPDIVCLQEVWAEDRGSDQAADLAQQLGYFHARSPAPYWEGFAFSNAVLSRWPIMSSESMALPRADGEPGHRTAILVWIDAPFGPVPVVSTHLDYPFDQSAQRVAQVQALCTFVAAKRGNPETSFPVVIGADLNAVPDSDEIRALTGRSTPPIQGLVFQDSWELAGDGLPGWTWHGANPHLSEATWPNRRLDYLLVSWPRPRHLGTPMRCWIAGDEPVDGVVGSDHYAVVADLRAG